MDAVARGDRRMPAGEFVEVGIDERGEWTGRGRTTGAQREETQTGGERSNEAMHSGEE